MKFHALAQGNEAQKNEPKISHQSQLGSGCHCHSPGEAEGRGAPDKRIPKTALGEKHTPFFIMHHIRITCFLKFPGFKQEKACSPKRTKSPYNIAELPRFENWDCASPLVVTLAVIARNVM